MHEVVDDGLILIRDHGECVNGGGVLEVDVAPDAFAPVGVRAAAGIVGEEAAWDVLDGDSATLAEDERKVGVPEKSSRTSSWWSQRSRQ